MAYGKVPVGQLPSQNKMLKRRAENSRSLTKFLDDQKEFLVKKETNLINLTKKVAKETLKEVKDVPSVKHYTLKGKVREPSPLTPVPKREQQIDDNYSQNSN